MAGKKQSSKSKTRENKELAGKILGIFSSSPHKRYNYKQIAKLINIKDQEVKEKITSILYDLVGEGHLTEQYTGKFHYRAAAGYITGKVEMTSSHNAFIHSEELEESVFVHQDNLNHALPGDVVKLYLFAKRKKRHLEGEVVEILTRSKDIFVGIIEVSRNFAFLRPDSKDVPYDFFIPLEKLNGAKNGQKAIVRITDWPAKAKNPFAEVTEVLGFPGENETEMHAILAEFNLPYRFDEIISREAEKIEAEIPDKEYKRRRDFREITTFTIDPADAKDFDDALSFKVLDNGNYEVGIHIADVTHYVKPGTLLDEEAQERGTSVYLVDRVVPMLPERLSNFICSLRPDEEKLCFSAVFEMTKEAEVAGEWYGKTIIKSNRRFSYEEAQEVLETGEGDFAAELVVLNDLARQLRNKRFAEGSIAFERAEVRFDIDESGKPLGVYVKEYRESNQLIEEYMLLANRGVATWVNKHKKGNKEKTFVYRIHDKPDREKLDSFSTFISKFGYRVSTSSNKKISQSINKLLDDIQGKKEQNILENLAIRTMAKAEYSTKNIGHYGLSFKYYTHFTSPIRRYPDMLAHRLLHHYLNKGQSLEKSKYEKMCQHSSEMERRAVEAERSSIKYKQVEFMMDKIGQEFSGIISGVKEWGLYVELVENKCEGLVHIRELDDDFYVFDEDDYSLTGRLHEKKYQLGDNVKVEILRANLFKKQLDFGLVEEFAEQ